MKALIAGFVALVGLLAGAAIVGPPHEVPDDVRHSDIVASDRPPAGAPPTSRPSRDAQTTTTGPATATADLPMTTDGDVTTTDPAAKSDVTAAAPATTVAPTSSAATIATTVTSATSTTAATTTTDVPTSTTTPSEDLGRRVVVANAVGTRGLASQIADRLRGLGYEDVIADDARLNRDTTVVYFEPGLEEAARRLLVSLGLDPNAVAPTPGGDLVFGDAAGELWLLVGRDLP